MCNTASFSYSTIGGGCSNIAGGTGSTVGGGCCNKANQTCGNGSVISGGYCNTASSSYSTIGGGRLNAVYSAGSIVSGGECNTACATGAWSSLGGGRGNTASGLASTIAGGCNNTASARCSTIGGGRSNTASGYDSAISGGYNNAASGATSTVGGGFANTSSNTYATVSGGSQNRATAWSSTVSGGYCNTSSGCNSSILGGCRNTASAHYSAVLVGKCNVASGCYSAILGGCGNTASCSFSGIFGCNINAIQANTFHVNNLAIVNTPTQDQAATNYLVRDAVSGIVKYKTIPGPTVYGLFAQTSNSTTISGTLSELSLIGSGIGSLSVPSNGFSVGDSFAVRISGDLGANNGDTLTLRVKSGSAEFGVVGPINMPNVTSSHFSFDVTFTVRSLGTAGTASLLSSGYFTFTQNAGSSFEGDNFSTLNQTTFDTTIPNQLDVTAQFNSTNAANFIFTEIFVLNKIY
jgi:hypothetical protein